MGNDDWLLVLAGVFALFAVVAFIRDVDIRERRSMLCEFTGGNLIEDVSVDCGGYSYVAHEGQGAPWACASDGEIIWFIEAGSHDVITYKEFCGG